MTKTRQVPSYETYYEDLGNGNAEQRMRTTYRTETYTDTETRPVYRKEPVYDTRYYYYIDRYVYERSVDTGGGEDEPYWGDVNLEAKEREGKRKEKYTIFFTEREKEKSLKIPQSVWEDYDAGDEIVLKRNRVGAYSLPIEMKKKR